MLDLACIHYIMTTPSKIGAILQAARIAKELPKTQVAARAGISRNTLQQLEAGLGNVELKTLLAVCEVLALDILLAPKEVSAKMQTSFPARPHQPLPATSRPDRSGEPVSARRTSNFLNRMIHDMEQFATGNVRKRIRATTEDSKKDKK